MTTTAVIRTTEEWTQLREPWQRLLEDCSNRSPFMTWEWLDSWQRHFVGDRDLQVIVCRDNEEVLAVVPLVGSVHHRAKVEVRTVKLLGNGLSDQLGILVRPGREDVIALIARCFKDGQIPWDVLALDDLDLADPTAQALKSALAATGISASFDETVQCPYVPVTGDWETFYQAQIGKKTRTTNRQKLRKLGALGAMRFRWVTNSSDVVSALDAVRAMDERGAYHGEERIRPFDSERGREFFTDFATRFAENGWLLLGLLELDGAVVAYRFSFRYMGRHFDYFPGFSPELFKLSVGRLLITEMMQNCFVDGIDEVNFLRGFESWKEEWTALSRPNGALTAQNPSIASRCRVMMQKIPVGG